MSDKITGGSGGAPLIHARTESMGSNPIAADHFPAPKRDYGASDLPPEIEQQIKQATWAFFQSLVETAKASPEAFQQMVGHARRENIRAKLKARDKLIVTKAPAILDLRRFSYPGKTTQ